MLISISCSQKNEMKKNLIFGTLCYVKTSLSGSYNSFQKWDDFPL